MLYIVIEEINLTQKSRSACSEKGKFRLPSLA